ncbi:hypothetical protein V2J09_019440 [Rumex salicifolius]
MAAKLLHSLADDNPDLQKQIGCMTGILQIFDRQHIGLNHRRLLPPGNSQFSNANVDADSSNAYRRETMERISNKYTNDKRLSTESSRPSFSSSSRSSSFSSLDCGRLNHPDPSSLDRIIFPDTPSSDPVITQPSPSPKIGRLSLDLRDVVKDSMHRETRGLSVQQHMKEDGGRQISKPRNSPRPLQLSKSVDGSLESKKAPRYYSENQHARLSYETKDGSLRDARRYSYDGKEMKRLSSEPRDFSITTQRISDLPRLSLDSQESSMRSSSFEANSAYLPTNAQNGDDISNEDFSITKQLSRPPSVVAKLMGLETLPDNKPYRDGQCGSTISFEDNRHHSLPLKISDVCRPIRLPVSPRSSRKEPTSPRWRNAEMRPISSSKCSIEQAPWKHLEGSRTSQQQAQRRQKSPESTSKTSPSVYSEIEKRLKDIEFKQSGKDLRALKQILEAMQAKGFLGMSKEEQNLNIGTQSEEEQLYTGSSRKSAYMNPNESHRNNSGGSAPRRTSSEVYESPIVIMKPAKLVQRSGIPASSLIPIDGLPALGLQGRNITHHGKLDSMNRRPSKDQSSRESQRENTARSSNDRKANSRNLREAQNTTRTQRGLSDNTSKSSTSPRLQKKLEFDKRSRPPTPPDSSKSRRQSNHQSTEGGAGGSPGGRRRPKPNIVQQNTDQMSETSSLRDDVSMQSSHSAATLEPRCIEVTEHQILPEFLKYPDAGEIKTSSSTRSSDDELVEELAVIAPEHTSPVSVLDDSPYRESSPLKQTSSQDHEGIEIKTIEQDNNNGRWNLSDLSHSDSSRFSTEINRDKLQSIENLIQKLQRLNTNHDEERTDYIASLCENSNSNPDHRYVSEILLASGLLLRDLSSGLSTFQLHPSGYPINPELFLVLEQTKSSSFICKIEKFHRKLVFDSVNEILSRKLGSLGHSDEPWLKPSKLSRKTLNAQKLLADLCDELEQLSNTGRQELSLDDEEDDPLKAVLWEDVMHRSGSWTDFHGDISGIVLDVERSIFKELVNEVVIGEAASCRGKQPSRRRRQLFSK